MVFHNENENHIDFMDHEQCNLTHGSCKSPFRPIWLSLIIKSNMYALERWPVQLGIYKSLRYYYVDEM